MKMKYLLGILLLFALISVVYAETFMPQNGTFAYKEVEIHEINGINFTLPTDFKITKENKTYMSFKDKSKNKISISVVKNGKIHKIKENKTKNITSAKTMLGSVKGYLVDKNGTYTFSYKEGKKLVVIKSKDMSLMIGAIGKD